MGAMWMGLELCVVPFNWVWLSRIGAIWLAQVIFRLDQIKVGLDWSRVEFIVNG